jgi:hypothetical protein
MQKADPLIRTKLHLPFIRPGLVSRPRLKEPIAQGLCGPLAPISAPELLHFRYSQIHLPRDDSRPGLG